MSEQKGNVSNPLTIVAVFAGVTEVASTIALASVRPDLQTAFVWFLIAFPSALVVLFFGTLLFRPNALCAPREDRADAVAATK